MLAEVILQAGAKTLEKPALRYLDRAGETSSMTFSELIERARHISAFLTRENCVSQSVILAFPTCLQFLPSLLGCLQAGALPVPAVTPVHSEDRLRIGKIASNCNAAFGLTVRNLQNKLSDAGAIRDNEIAWISVEDIWDDKRVLSEQKLSPPFSAGAHSVETAYLQYTSGSTNSPRGVEVTASGLLHNLHCIADALTLGPDDVCVTWLPHFHDMGLVGTLLAPLFVGATSVIMSPFDFVRSPLKWLTAISQFRGTFTASPNFGYELCAARVTAAERAKLDLSSWRAAPNGSEPVRAETVRRFVEAFAPAGFAPQAMAPCYGLAEATLVVSMSRPSQPVSFAGFERASLSRGIVQPSSEPAAVTLVGCGPPVAGTEIAIVDPESRRRRGPDQVGEIWVRSESVAKGYHNPDSEAPDCFGAEIEDEQGSFLRTGDLGFLYKGELFVTGRMKDLIIIRGRNIHPHDIELTARQAHPELSAQRGVAFAVAELEAEELVILHEAKGGLQAHETQNILAKLRAAINRGHGVDPVEIALVPRRSIGLTSSGKLARWRSRLDWIEGRMPAIARWRREPRADETP